MQDEILTKMEAVFFDWDKQLYALIEKHKGAIQRIINEQRIRSENSNSLMLAIKDIATTLDTKSRSDKIEQLNEVLGEDIIPFELFTTEYFLYDQTKENIIDVEAILNHLLSRLQQSDPVGIDIETFGDRRYMVNPLLDPLNMVIYRPDNGKSFFSSITEAESTLLPQLLSELKSNKRKHKDTLTEYITSILTELNKIHETCKGLFITSGARKWYIQQVDERLSKILSNAMIESLKLEDEVDAKIALLRSDNQLATTLLNLSADNTVFADDICEKTIADLEQQKKAAVEKYLKTRDDIFEQQRKIYQLTTEGFCEIIGDIDAFVNIKVDRKPRNTGYSLYQIALNIARLCYVWKSLLHEEVESWTIEEVKKYLPLFSESAMREDSATPVEALREATQTDSSPAVVAHTAASEITTTPQPAIADVSAERIETPSQPIKITIAEHVISELYDGLKAYFAISQHGVLKKILSGESNPPQRLVFNGDGIRLIELFRRVWYNEHINANKATLSSWIVSNFEYIGSRRNSTQKQFSASTTTGGLSKKSGDIPEAEKRICNTPKLRYKSVEELIKERMPPEPKRA